MPIFKKNEINTSPLVDNDSVGNEASDKKPKKRRRNVSENKKLEKQLQSEIIDLLLTYDWSVLRANQMRCPLRGHSYSSNTFFYCQKIENEEGENKSKQSLTSGLSDLIAFRGKEYCYIEVKRDEKKKLSPNQIIFRDIALKSDANYILANSIESIYTLLTERIEK